jgi:hypothetical protein
MPPKRTGKAAAAPKGGSSAAACGDSGAASCGKATGKSVNGDSGLVPLLHSDHLQAITVHTPGVGQSSTVESDLQKTSADGQTKQPKSLQEQKDSKRALWMSMLTLLISIPALVGA